MIFTDDKNNTHVISKLACCSLANELTLSQTGGSDYTHHITTALAPPDFQTFLRP